MALKGKQKKLDKNNNGRIDAEDFKILQGSKKGMRMGGMAGYGSARTSGMGLQDESMKPGKVMKAKTGKQVTKGRGMTKGDLEYAKVRSKHPRSKKYDKPGYSPVFKSAMEESENTVKVQRIVDDLVKKKGTKDIDAIGYLTEGRATAREGSFKKGSMIKAKTGKSVKPIPLYKELGFINNKDFLITEASMGNKNAKRALERLDKKKKKAKGGMLKARRGVLANAMESQRALQKSKYLSALEKAMKENKDRLTARDIEAAKKMPEKRKGGMLKARSGKLAESMKKLREKAYEKSGKKMKGVGRYGKDEYMIQKKLPGMRTGKAVDTLKVIPTVKGRKQIAKDFSPSRINKKTNKYKDYK